MSVRFQRHLGTVHQLEPGQFTLRTMSGSPALMCPLCGSIFDLPITHKWDDVGRVMPAVKCADSLCVFFDLVQLVDIGEDVIP